MHDTLQKKNVVTQKVGHLTLQPSFIFVNTFCKVPMYYCPPFYIIFIVCNWNDIKIAKMWESQN
jgi:hypothetical protein